MPKQTINVVSPIGGVNRVSNREGQPSSTCWNALNVLPFDGYGRARVAQRYGTVKQYATQLATAPIQGLLGVNQISYPITLNSTGLPIYTEPFTDLASFQAVWANVPSTWTVSGGKLHVPAGFASDPAGPPLIYRPGFDAGDMKFNFNLTYAGSAPSTFAPINIDFGMNPTVPTVADVQVGAGVALGWIFGGGIAFSSTTLINAGPAIYSSTHTDGSFAGSPGTSFASSTTFACSGTYLSSQALGVMAGEATTIGVPYVVPLTGRQFIYFSVDTLPAGVSVAIDGLNFINPGPFSQPISQTLLIAVCNGFVWVGQPAPSNTIAKASNQSSALLSATSAVSMASVNFTGVQADPNAVNLGVYIVDGMSSTVAVLNTSTMAMQTLVPLSSTALPPTYCGLACNWRGRLVLAGDAHNPANFYMSRAGDPSDWDYSQTDPAAAVAGNLSKSGQIGEPITALIPYTDDCMLISCTHSLWMLQGDPADGGTIVPVSNALGIVGKDAWCVDPSGVLFFLANGGLYSVQPLFEAYRPPEQLTLHSWNQFFLSQNWSFTRTSLVWDADLHYLHMFFTPTNATLGTHLVYDARNGGLWPVAFPSNQGPNAACLFLGDNSPSDRVILLGGQDGYIRAFDNSALDDDGVGIFSFVALGPFKPFPEAGLMTACTVDMGELLPTSSSTAWGAVVTIASGPDAFGVTEGLPHSSTQVGLTLDRRTKTFRQRLRGGWFGMLLANGVDNQYFSFESALLEFEPAGRNRERR